MWFIGVEVEQETSAPPPKKNPGSAPEKYIIFIAFSFCEGVVDSARLKKELLKRKIISLSTGRFIFSIHQ